MIIAAICNGVSRYALDKAVACACERQVWQVPIGAHQGLAHPLAEAKIGLEAARLMTRHDAAGYDSGTDAGEQSNMAKFLSADAAIRCLDQAIEVHGAPASPERSRRPTCTSSSGCSRPCRSSGR